ncbi:hypothetical protein DRO66_03735 [Candidatus Bathyarchaeota archaeon]|nr:MAG: hypothetical protein DRO66_03735 [Candidatus Bathyarchaeota archaeon]
MANTRIALGRGMSPALSLLEDLLTRALHSFEGKEISEALLQRVRKKVSVILIRHADELEQPPVEVKVSRGEAGTIRVQILNCIGITEEGE